MSIFIQRLVTVFLVPGLLLLAPGAQQFVLAQAGPEDELRAAADEFDRLTRALEASLADLPRDSFDPEAIVLDVVGFDALELFAWVRDNTSLVPYRGALRGPRGVLMDRVGNSLDRSLLLYDLLLAAGEQVRLARGVLSADESRALFDELAATEPAPRPRAPGGNDGDLERYAAAGGVDVAELRAAAEADAAARERLRADLEERVADQTARLADIAGLPAAGDATGALQALNDHWWVQWSDGGSWTDLDLAAESSGVALTVATETLQPTGLADLDPSLLHTVTVRLVAECWDGGRLTRTELLASDPLLPAESLGGALSLRHAPIGWSGVSPDEARAAEPRGERLEAAADIEHWVPVLRVGDATVVGLAVSEDCAFPTADSLTWPGEAVGEAVEDATANDLFTTPPTGDTDVAGASSLTAEWLEYEVRVPGSEARVIRRQLFDRIGAAARADGGGEPSGDGLDWKLALLGQTDMLLQPHRLSEAYVEQLLGDAILASRDALLAAAREAEPGPSDALTEALEALAVPSVQLYTLAVARQADMPSTVYIAAPNILSHHSQLRSDDGVFGTLQGFDIVVNDIEIHPSALDGAAELRLRQGVRDTNAEALIAPIQCDAIRIEGVDCTLQPNAADRLAAGDDAWALVTSSDELAALSLASVPAGVDEALAAGRVALVNLDGEPVWWQLDPETGTALGMGANGWGISVVEWAILFAIAFDTGVCVAYADIAFTCVGFFVLGFGAFIGIAIGAVVMGSVLALLGVMLGAFDP